MIICQYNTRMRCPESDDFVICPLSDDYFYQQLERYFSRGRRTTDDINIGPKYKKFDDYKAFKGSVMYFCFPLIDNDRMDSTIDYVDFYFQTGYMDKKTCHALNVAYRVWQGIQSDHVEVIG